jgi:hypothetical protein
MFKFLFILLITSSTLYAIQNPTKLGNTYNSKNSDGRSFERPLEERETMPSPIDFKVDHTSHNIVGLSWDHPYNAQQKFAYQIYRNKVLLVELPSNQQVYNDQHLLPSQTYHYEIFAVDQTGWRSQPNNLKVTTQQNIAPTFMERITKIELKKSLELNSDLYTFDAQDLNNDPLNYTLKGQDKSLFTIDSKTGTLKNKQYLIRDKQYQLKIEVSDGNSVSSTPFVIKT